MGLDTIDTLIDWNNVSDHSAMKLNRIKKLYFIKQDRYDNIVDRLQFLYKEFNTARGDDKFSIQQSINKIEKELRDLDEELGKLEEEKERAILKMAQRDPLYFALRELDYESQEDLFVQMLTKSRDKIGAFIIHGESRFGQRWLYNRLITKLPEQPQIFTEVDLSSISQSWTLDTLTNSFCGMPVSSISNSISILLEKWETQTIIIVIHGFNEAQETFKQDFVHKFWLELIKEAKNVLKKSPRHWLLFFFVEESDTWTLVNSWPVTFIECIETKWEEPHMFVKPPEITLLGQDEITKWIEKVKHRLLRMKPSLLEELTVETILKGQRFGVPEEVFDNICKVFEVEYMVMEAQWIRY